MNADDFFMFQSGMSRKQAEETDEVSADYTIENGGRTHILVLDFPDPVDEECFLLSLKTYMKAQSNNLTAIQDGKKNH